LIKSYVLYKFIPLITIETRLTWSQILCHTLWVCPENPGKCLPTNIHKICVKFIHQHLYTQMVFDCSEKYSPLNLIYITIQVVQFLKWLDMDQVTTTSCWSISCKMKLCLALKPVTPPPPSPQVTHHQFPFLCN
jgi:hypothetical protein